MPITPEDLDFDGPGSGVNLALMTLPDNSPLATASAEEREAAFASKPVAETSIADQETQQNTAVAFLDAYQRAIETEADPAHTLGHQNSLKALLDASKLFVKVFPDLPMTLPKAPEKVYQINDMAILTGEHNLGIRDLTVRVDQIAGTQAHLTHVNSNGILSKLGAWFPLADLKPLDPKSSAYCFKPVLWNGGTISVNFDAMRSSDIRACLPDRKIDAIKLYRQKTNAGLKESKDAVEYVSAHFIPDEQPPAEAVKAVDDFLSAYVEHIACRDMVMNATLDIVELTELEIKRLNDAKTFFILTAEKLADQISKGFVVLQGEDPEQARNIVIASLRQKLAACETDLKMVRGMVNLKNNQVVQLTNDLRKAQNIPHVGIDDILALVETYLADADTAINTHAKSENSAGLLKSYEATLRSIRAGLQSFRRSAKALIDGYAQTREDLMKTREQLTESNLNLAEAHLALVNAMLNKEELPVPKGQGKTSTEYWSQMFDVSTPEAREKADYELEKWINTHPGWEIGYMVVLPPSNGEILRYVLLKHDVIDYPSPEGPRETRAKAAAPVPEPVLSHDIIIGQPLPDKFSIANTLRMPGGADALKQAGNQAAINAAVTAATASMQQWQGDDESSLHDLFPLPNVLMTDYQFG